MHKLNLKTFEPLHRIDGNGKRHYVGSDGKKLPSITTILGATANKEFLAQWRQRVGDEEAKRITAESANMGTLIHSSLEKYMIHEDFPKAVNSNMERANELASIVIDKGLKGKLTEVYGVEAPLYVQDLFAGSTDGVGIYNGIESIIDFKNTRKFKKEDWIWDYKLQCTAYGMAANITYGFNVKQFVILIVNKDTGEYQDFVRPMTEELQYHWLKRVEKYLDM